MSRGKRKPAKKGSAAAPPSPPPPGPRRLWGLLLAVLALAGAAGLLALWPRAAAPLASGAFSGRNLLFVTIDTLRADRLGAYGSREGLTPHLDRLASEGLVFDDVLAHVPLTLPSHASIFTGKFPSSHGVHDNGTFPLDDEIPTLATALSAKGYRTAAFVGAFVLDARFGLDRGFDVYDDYYGEKRAYQSFVELERPAEAVVAPAETWIEGSGEGPWFAWVHVFDPHAPYEAPQPFRSKFASDPYGAEVAYVDDVLGGLFDRLAAKGLLDDTLVVVAGDHGEALGEHGESTHGIFAYNATLKVPLVLWAKGLTPGRFSRRVRHVDVTPTVLDLLGVEALPRTDGASLRAALAAPDAYEPADSYFEALNPHLTRDWAPLRGLVRGSVKFIDLPIPELYDLDADPHEERNLAPQRARLAEELKSALERFVGDVDPAELASADAETVRRLESLGYLVAPSAGERKSAYTEADDPKRLVGIANAHDEAAALFQSGRTEEAVAMLRRLLDEQPRSSFAHQKLAYALHQLGRTREAVSVLERGIENGVSDLSLLSLLGSYLIESGELEKAQTILAGLVESHPDYAEGHNYLGVAYARLGRAAEARAEFERVLDLDPSSATTHNNLGSLALGLGQMDEAVAQFRRAIEIDPRLASAANGLGVAYARAGDFDAAIESWERAVELDPRQFDAMYNVAMALADESRDRAIPYLERFAREAPKARYGADIVKVRNLLAQWRAGS